MPSCALMRVVWCVWVQLRNAKGSMRTAEVRLRLQKTMQRDAAVFRTQESLENGVKAVDEHFKEFQDVKISDRSLIWNTDLLETLELQNIMDNALVTMYVPRSDPLLQTRLVPDTCAAFARQCVLPVLEAGVKAACGGT
jgi:succinate dehydrogenase / fumarate reductase flavoprotein subunit